MFLGIDSLKNKIKKTGILLINLGTPDAPTEKAVRAYLAEFLSDVRVIDKQTLLWKIILHGVILRIRPKRSAKLYQKIWREDGISPLLYNSRKTAFKLGRALGSDYAVKLGMRYGNPSILTAMQSFEKESVSNIIILPLYPQYSATTSASALDGFYQSLRTEIPNFEFIASYANSDIYTQAISDSILRFQANHGKPDKLIFSFHGLPERYISQGDPYYQQCVETVESVSTKLGLSDADFCLTFQSRVGREKWIEPYTEATLEKLANEGVKSVQVICPGFSCYCLETLEEIDIQMRASFLQNGGESFAYIPALNDSEAQVEVLKSVLLNKADLS
jgi:ferrochelatase